MAMNKTQLGQAIADIIASPDAPPDKKQAVVDLWTDIAGAIIDHITTNAEVTTTVAAGIAVQVAVATGTGATSAPGSGSGTIS